MQKKISIRTMKRLNVEEIAPMMLSSEPWKSLKFKKHDLRRIAANSSSKILFGAYQGKKLIGFASHSSGFLGGVYLNLLVVDPEMRGQGVGQLLMRHALEKLIKKNKNYYLCVSHFNKSAIRFYRGLKFEEVGRIKNFFLKGKHEILMRKTSGPIRD